MKAVKLGRKYEGPCCVEAKPSSEPEMSYPSLYIDRVEGLPEFPKEGVMTVRFKLCSRNENVKEGSESVNLDILEITDVEEVGRDSEVGEETSEALDKLVKTLKKSY